MSTSPSEIRAALAQRVAISEDSLTVDLSDGRTVTVPLAWYPKTLAWPASSLAIRLAKARHPCTDGSSHGNALANSPLQRPATPAAERPPR